MNAKQPAITIEGISRRFGDVVALDNVNLRIEPGELFFLLGPSGCGKTTLLRILAGLETPDSGSLQFDGKDVLDLPPYKRGAPMVFQNYALWPHLSVRENIAFGLVERGIKRIEIAAMVDAVLGRVGLDGLGARMPGQLSGGQQQRVVLARALVLNPAVVLLDEPLSNLDAKLRAEMREEIERLHVTTGITFIYVTHDQVEALTLADRMAVMHKGRILAMNTPQALYHRPPNLFCAEFLGEANIIDGTVMGHEGSILSVATPFGIWKAREPEGRQPDTGAPVKVMIRPEYLRPGTLPHTANRLSAEVTRVRMNGSTITVMLQAAGVSMRATILNQFNLPIVRGAPGAWSVASDDTIALVE